MSNCRPLMFFASFSFCACGGDAHGALASDASGGHPGASTWDSGNSDSDGAHGSIRVWGTMVEETAPGAPKQVPSAGTRLCLYENDSIPCVTTGADGTFVIEGVPAHTDIAVTMTKAGFIPIIWTMRTSGADLEWKTPQGNPGMSIDHGQNVERDRAHKGDIEFFGYNASGPAVGVTAKITSGPSDAPQYQGFDSQPIPGVTATVSGYGFFRVAPGNVTITFEAQQGKCIALGGLWGWPGNQLNEVRSLVVEAFDTYAVGVLCPNAPSAVQPSDAGTSIDASHD